MFWLSNTLELYDQNTLNSLLGLKSNQYKDMSLLKVTVVGQTAEIPRETIAAVGQQSDALKMLK